MLVKSQNLKAAALTGVTVVLAVIACATIIANSAPEVLVLKMLSELEFASDENPMSDRAGRRFLRSSSGRLEGC